MPTQLFLKNAEATLELGRVLATSLPQELPQQNIFLQGDLGAGKTTMVRGLVEALPNGHEAEVSSPSFNLMNLYPTHPETAHVDLYRLEGAEPDSSILEIFDQGQHLVIVEWIQYLPEMFWPPSYLLLSWTNDSKQAQGRTLELSAHGEEAKVYKQNIVANAQKFHIPAQ